MLLFSANFLRAIADEYDDLTKSSRQGV